MAGGKDQEIYLIYPAMTRAEYFIYSKQEYDIERKPPLGLLYLASSLSKHGIESKIFDQAVDRFSFEEMAKKARGENPLFIGIYSDSYLKPGAIELTRTIKESNPKIKVVMGGPVCVEYEDLHNNQVDIVCHGEGEETVCDIADYLSGRIDIKGIKGISFLKDGRINKNENRPLIEDLDSIPFPDRDKIRLNAYHDFHYFGMKTPYTTMVASRGCPFRCSFCASHGFWGGRHRQRSPENVTDEIELLVRRYKVRYIGFKDDIFGLNTEWLYDFADQMKKRDLKVRFSCLLHPSSFKGHRRKVLSLLKEAGLDAIVLGVQSVGPGVLGNIHRSPEDPEQAAEMIKEAKRHSICMVIEFIFGLPGDSEEVFRNNLRFSLKSRPHYALFFNLTKIPGSEIEIRFRSNKITAFSEKSIQGWTARCQRRFFSDPRIIFQDILYVLAKNPGWFLTAGRKIPYLLKATGIIRT